MVVLTLAMLAALGAELAQAFRQPAAAEHGWEAAINSAIVTHFYAEVWNAGRLARAERFVAADHIYHDPTTPDAATGPAGVVGVVGALRRAFPDLVLTLDEVVATGDRVVVRFTARGTHRGPFLGAAGTGRTVSTTGVAVFRVAGREIAETWVTWDTYDLALQVGLAFVPVAAPDDGDRQGGDVRSGRPN